MPSTSRIRSAYGLTLTVQNEAVIHRDFSSLSVPSHHCALIRSRPRSLPIARHRSLVIFFPLAASTRSGTSPDSFRWQHQGFAPVAALYTSLPQIIACALSVPRDFDPRASSSYHKPTTLTLCSRDQTHLEHRPGAQRLSVIVPTSKRSASLNPAEIVWTFQGLIITVTLQACLPQPCASRNHTPIPRLTLSPTNTWCLGSSL